MTLLRYVKGTKNLRLCYSKSNDNLLEGFFDASLSKNIDDPRSVAGHVFLSQGGAISWYSKRLTLSALSTVEAELLSMSIAAQEALWLRDLASNLGIIDSNYSIPIFCDSQGAIALAKNGSCSVRTNHIVPRYTFVKDCVNQNLITLNYKETQNMIADMLTKPADKNVVKMCVRGMGLQ